MKKFFAFCAVLFPLFSLFCGIAGATENHAKQVIFGDQEWNSIQFHHRVMGYLLQHGYGLQPEYCFTKIVPSLIDLRRGDNHIVMEVWTQTRQDWWNVTRRSDKVQDFGSVFPDAPTGLYIPTYVISGDPERGIEPMAPDLKDIFDLPRYVHLFADPETPSKGCIYNAVAGWKGHERYKTKIQGYQVDGKPLGEFFVLRAPSSGQALQETILQAYREGKPIIAYYWEPTALLAELDMTLLKEPDYDPQVFQTTGLCQHPKFSVRKAVNKAWVEKHPEAVPPLERYFLDMDTVNRVLQWMHYHENTPEKAAVWFLKNYPELWHSWVEDPQKIEAVEEALDREPPLTQSTPDFYTH